MWFVVAGILCLVIEVGHNRIGRPKYLLAAHDRVDDPEVRGALSVIWWTQDFVFVGSGVTLLLAYFVPDLFPFRPVLWAIAALCIYLTPLFFIVGLRFEKGNLRLFQWIPFSLIAALIIVGQLS